MSPVTPNAAAFFCCFTPFRGFFFTPLGERETINYVTADMRNVSNHNLWISRNDSLASGSTVDSRMNQPSRGSAPLPPALSSARSQIQNKFVWLEFMSLSS